MWKQSERQVDDLGGSRPVAANQFRVHPNGKIENSTRRPNHDSGEFSSYPLLSRPSHRYISFPKPNHRVHNWWSGMALRDTPLLLYSTPDPISTIFWHGEERRLNSTIAPRQMYIWNENRILREPRTHFDVCHAQTDIVFSVNKKKNVKRTKTNTTE